MSLVHNERVKLVAATLNNVGVAALVTGVVAPMAGYVYGIGQPIGTGRLAGAITMWLAVGSGLHILSQWVLRKLRE